MLKFLKSLFSSSCSTKKVEEVSTIVVPEKVEPTTEATTKATKPKGKEKISDEKIAKIKALKAEGKSQAFIANEVGVSIPTVKKYS